MKAMATLQDLIEEAKLRTVWWALCIFAISYFLTRKSSFLFPSLCIASVVHFFCYLPQIQATVLFCDFELKDCSLNVEVRILSGFLFLLLLVTSSLGLVDGVVCCSFFNNWL